MTSISRPLAVLLLLVVTGCGVSGDRKEDDWEAPLEDVLTLELTFGAENIDEEYMLVRPWHEGVGVDIEGNIMVVDEDYVKVFDSNGVPKRLLGGTGEGPGEFSRPRSLWISANGYYTVFGGQFGFTANYFRPDHSYIERVNYMSTRPFREIMDANQLSPARPELVYCLGESERVYTIDSRDQDRQNRSRTEIYLFYQDSDSLRVLANYSQSNYIAGPPQGGALSMGTLGMLLVAPLPGKRIVYIHTYHNSEITTEGPSYRLTFLDLDSMEKTYLDHRYAPVEIEWEPLSYPEEYRQRNPEQWRRTQELNKIVEEFIAERKYESPIIILCTDDRYVFAFTTTRNDSNEVKVDVFDADRRSYICSAWFPASYGLHIRNGYAYKVSDYYSEDEFPRIEKYRIDPRVYGRR